MISESTQSGDFHFMSATYERSAELDAIRERIDHPIIDGDGHIIEYLPLVRDIVVELAGPAVAERFDLVVEQWPADADALARATPGDGAHAAAVVGDTDA